MPPKGQCDAERSVTLTQNRKEVDPSTRQCNVCEAFGHTWLECPKGNKNMQKKEIARRAERQARNGARAMMELSKYVQYPGKAHMDAALHVLRYLRGTYDQAILY